MSRTEDTQGSLWEVFVQAKKGLPFKHTGSVHAYDKEMAVQNARDLYTRRGEGRGLWVVPSDSIIAVDPSNDEIFLILLTIKCIVILPFMICLTV